MQITPMRKKIGLLLAGVLLMGAATVFNSEQMNYRFPATGAVLRRLTARLGDTVSVGDFCTAKGAGEDDTTCLQSAINAAAGKTLYFPRPVTSYKVTGSLTISAANTRLRGDGSKIFMAFTSALPVGGILFDVTASNVEFDNLWIDSTGSVNSPLATINHYAIRFHGTSGTHLTNLRVRNCAFTNLPWNDTLGAVLTTHAVYVQWADNVTVQDSRFDAPAGAAVFFSGVTNGYVLNNRINDTGWYSVQFNDLVSNSRIAGNSITGTTLGSRVWGGSINLMSNDSTGTACGTPGCARINNVEVDHNYISGNHSYTGAVHIESCSHIKFHDNILEKITLTLAADMLARYGAYFGSAPPFYVDGSPAVYIRPYVRPATAAGTNEGPNDHIEITNNLLIAGSVGAIAVYADAQDNGSGTLLYSDTLSVTNNQIQSLDNTHYFSNGISVHGQQGGWKNVTIEGNSVSGFPDGTSPNLGLIGTQGLVAAPVLDVIVANNNLTVAGGVASTTTHLGIGIGAYTTRARVVHNSLGAFWVGIRTFTNSLNPILGVNSFSGSGSSDYLVGVGPIVNFGTVPVYGSLYLTGRNTDLAPTNIVATAPAGEYMLCGSARTTTSGTGTVATLNLNWTDEGGVKTHSIGTFALNSVTVTGQINFCDYIHVAAASNIVASITAGTYGTSVYALSVTVTKVN
jgi:hypothetical protein